SPTWLAVLWLALLLGIVSVWSLGGTAWQGLLSGLLGMAIGGGTVWAIRLVATAALNRTAMGFGDVTLMAFLGAALGWQGALIAFFLSPFAAIIMTLVQIILFRENRIAFGPFLCAGAALTVAFWNATWVDRLGPVLFGLGLQWFLFILIGALVLMAVMLIVYRGIKIAILGRLQSE
ncbi:MAG: prepilin peptidase, partial [Planctomycetota bacterium]